MTKSKIQFFFLSLVLYVVSGTPACPIDWTNFTWTPGYECILTAPYTVSSAQFNLNGAILDCNFNPLFAGPGIAGSGNSRLSNFTIKNCVARAILLQVAPVMIELDNINFYDCTAPEGQSGGAVYSLGPTTVNNCYFERCNAMGGGGGIFVKGLSYMSGDTFVNCSGQNGGGFYADTLSHSSNMTFIGCRADISGGCYMTESEDAYCDNCVFNGCVADNGGCFRVGGNAYFNNSLFINCTARVSANAMSVANFAILSNVSFINNTGPDVALVNLKSCLTNVLVDGLPLINTAPAPACTPVVSSTSNNNSSNSSGTSSTEVPLPDSSSAAVFALIAEALLIPVLLVLVLLGLFFYLVTRGVKAAPAREVERGDSSETPPESAQSLASTSTRGAGSDAALPTYSDLGYFGRGFIDKNDLVFVKEIGRGAFGRVFQATFHGASVAVKQTKDWDAPPEAMRAFQEESRTMLALAPHPNVVTVLGYVLDPPGLVQEFLVKGSLDKYLQRHEIPEEKKMSICQNVCAGMVHLHRQRLIHRDLAARNILLTRDLTAKVSDFGLSRLLGSDQEANYTTAAVGPIRWMAPEAMNHMKYSKRSDVWSYGVVLWEVWTDCVSIPFSDTKNVLEVSRRVGIQHEHVPIPDEAPPIIRTVMQRCFAYEAEARPLFSEILLLLRNEAPGSSNSLTAETDESLDEGDHYAPATQEGAEYDTI